MDPQIIAAIIGAIGAFIGGIVAAIIGKVPIEDFFSHKARARNNIPDIMKTVWSAEWCHEDGSVYVADTVTFEKWKKNGQFIGYGEVTHNGKQYKYSIDGEVSPNRTVVLMYKAEKYPTQANIGIACLNLTSNAEKLDGKWAGRTSRVLPNGDVINTVSGGAVKMQKIKDLRS